MSKQYGTGRRRIAMVATGFAIFGGFTVAKAAVANAALPAVSVYNVHKSEGNAGTTPMPFSVKLSAPSGAPQWVQLQPGVGGPMPAAAGKDFNSAGPYLVNFAPGETAKVVNVPVYGDTLDEYDETFALKVVAHSPGVTLGNGQGIAQITDDDASPALSIDNVSKKEGTGGITDFTFSVKLSAISGKTVKVDAVGVSGSAHIPDDLTAGPATLTFLPGQTLRTYTAHVNGDKGVEPNETFKVQLSNPVNAPIVMGGGNGTIQNDDYLVIDPNPKPQPKPDPQPQPQPQPDPQGPADNGNGGNGGGGGIDTNPGNAGGGAWLPGSSDSSSDNGVAGGEGEQALSEKAIGNPEIRPAHNQVDWLTSGLLILLGACALGLILIAWQMSRRNRNSNA